MFCTNLACGHTFVAQFAVVRTLSPSAAPRSDVHLPIAPRPFFGKPAAANDDAPLQEQTG
jgi:hypothetical protein